MEAYTVRPGLTGPAQVYDRRSELPWESVFNRDMEYAQNVTFRNDCKLFFQTFISLFKGGSASGAGNAEHIEKREYFYPDYLLKSHQITDEQYRLGLKLAEDKQKETKKGYVEFQEQLHSEINILGEDNVAEQKNNDDSNN